MNNDLLPADLRVFNAVVRASSFSRAAEDLGMSAAYVTKRIRLLEASLGTPLFHRTTRSVQLTAAGKQLLDAARRGVREVEAGVREVRETQALQAGHVAVAATPIAAAALLPPVLARFETLYPGVRMSVRERQSGDVQAQVLQGEADFGVVPW